MYWVGPGGRRGGAGGGAGGRRGAHTHMQHPCPTPMRTNMHSTIIFIRQPQGERRGTIQDYTSTVPSYMAMPTTPSSPPPNKSPLPWPPTGQRILLISCDFRFRFRFVRFWYSSTILVQLNAHLKSAISRPPLRLGVFGVAVARGPTGIPRKRQGQHVEPTAPELVTI